jgi:hypothetical protein
MLNITYPQSEINRFNAEHEAERMNASKIEMMRKMCNTYSEKNDAGRSSDGEHFMGLIKGVLR